jgi:hypothetical protein
MPGHVFVVHTDISRVACDAWLLPTDENLRVEDTWGQEAHRAVEKLVGKLRSREELAKMRWRNFGGRRVLNLARVWPDKWSPAFLVNVGGLKYNCFACEIRAKSGQKEAKTEEKAGNGARAANEVRPASYSCTSRCSALANSNGSPIGLKDSLSDSLSGGEEFSPVQNRRSAEEVWLCAQCMEEAKDDCPAGEKHGKSLEVNIDWYLEGARTFLKEAAHHLLIVDDEDEATQDAFRLRAVRRDGETRFTPHASPAKPGFGQSQSGDGGFPQDDQDRREPYAWRIPPRNGRSRHLVSVPVVGTGLGGAAHDIGTVLANLFPVLYEAAERYQFDIALVTIRRPAFAAAVLARSRRFDDDPARIFPLLSQRLLDEAERLASLARRGSLVLFLGSGISAGAGLPVWQTLLDELGKRSGMTDEELDAMHTLDFMDQASLVERRLGSGELGRVVADVLEIHTYSLNCCLLAGLPVSEVRGFPTFVSCFYLSRSLTQSPRFSSTCPKN